MLTRCCHKELIIYFEIYSRNDAISIINELIFLGLVNFSYDRISGLYKVDFTNLLRIKYSRYWLSELKNIYSTDNYL